jgi:hypothetical protein
MFGSESFQNLFFLAEEESSDDEIGPAPPACNLFCTTWKSLYVFSKLFEPTQRKVTFQFKQVNPHKPFLFVI